MGYPATTPTRPTVQEPAPTRRELRRARRRRQIADAALKIVVEAGIDALTMPRLARELEIAVGGLYRYFDSKDHLLVSLELIALETYSARADQRLMGLQLPDDAPPQVRALARIWALLRSWTEFSAQEPTRYRLLETLVTDPRLLLDDEAQEQVQAHIDPVLRRCGDLLESAVEVGALDPGDPEVRVHVVWGALQGTALFRKQDQRRPAHLSASNLADAITESILVGWGADPAQLQVARGLVDPPQGRA
ncbi:MAG TPA: TetR/AcrR family transcriptional regulator [Deltaproteobacteria bacterium]|nr:TetR/AcrR family transcriptional regulator [Deltaproteobacteria bacterium]